MSNSLSIVKETWSKIVDFTKIADSVDQKQMFTEPVFLSTLYLVDYQKLKYLALKKLVPAHTTDMLSL